MTIQMNPANDNGQMMQYSAVLIKVYPDPSTYQNWVICNGETDNTSIDAIVDDILERYADAWKALAEM